MNIRLCMRFVNGDFQLIATAESIHHYAIASDFEENAQIGTSVDNRSKA